MEYLSQRDTPSYMANLNKNEFDLNNKDYYNNLIILNVSRFPDTLMLVYAVMIRVSPNKIPFVPCN